ncbi:zinc finger protein 878-like [Frankliniella occidentalis]|uniref:Zinc finger protein 878-like n=1 Tax=Frankliniella occidentalis TaxID=133901 RepID=A0A6J1SDJ2_FRAOC|nr:zinc finger protein 878-like [Frankliniella occidentalis]
MMRPEVVDIISACRLCLSMSPDNSEIFQNLKPSKSLAFALPQLISGCVGFEISQCEELPSKICNMCLQEVNRWAAFQAKCQSINGVLSKVVYQKCTLFTIDSKLKMIENPHPKRLLLPKTTAVSDISTINVPQENDLNLVSSSKKKSKSKQILDKDSNSTTIKHQKHKALKINITSKSAPLKDDEANNLEPKTGVFSEDSKQSTSGASKEIKEAQSNEIDHQTFVDLTTQGQQDDKEQELHSDNGGDCDSNVENDDDNVDYDDGDDDDIDDVDDGDDEDDDNTSCVSEKSSEDGIMNSSLDEDSDVPLEVAQDDDSKPWRLRTVKCPKCPKIFPKHHGLKFHLRRIHGLFTLYPCAVCGHTSVLSKKREKHIIKSHEDLLNTNAKCMCKVCGLILKSRVSLWRHKKKHKEDRCCKVCNTMFKSLEELDVHSKTSHPTDMTENPPQNEGDYKFKCHLCENIAFRSEKDWREHYMLIHFTQAVYACDLCDKTYHTKEHLEMHKHTHAGEKPYMCELCASRFSGKSSLKSHLRKIHSAREYVCKVCQKKYGSYAGLYYHNRIQHLGIAPFVCHECGKKFKSTNGLLFHMRTHSGEKPYSCEHCSFASRSLAGLYAHRVTHSDDKPFKCDECDKSFKLKGWLQVHKKTHAGVKKFVCDICKFSFIANYQLKSHMKVHSGERPHICDICSKSFARKDTLTEHRRTHTKETKYTCKTCNLGFMFLKPFKKHKCTANTSNSNNLDLQRVDLLLDSLEEEDE